MFGQHAPVMPDEDTASLALRTADQLRTDIANLECSQEFLMQQINRLPTRRRPGPRDTRRHVLHGRPGAPRDRHILAPRPMTLDLTGEEAVALLRVLNRAIEDDRYPLSPRIRTLRNIRAKLPGAPLEPPPARPPRTGRPKR